MQGASTSGRGWRLRREAVAVVLPTARKECVGSTSTPTRQAAGNNPLHRTLARNRQATGSLEEVTADDVAGGEVDEVVQNLALRITEVRPCGLGPRVHGLGRT